MDLTSYVLGKNHTNKSIDQNTKIPLDIQTYDDDPNTTHPSVVYVSKGWNGYRYWMAHTPYPEAGRENPSILASNNGVDWEVPTGASNPVVTNAETKADGYNFNSDANIVLLNDNRMAIYYRPVGDTYDAVYRKTSSNGKDWANKELCVLSTTHNEELLSPSIVAEEDGTFTMYTVFINELDVTHTIQKRTSTDGISFSSPVNISTPNFNFLPWHIDTAKHGSKYHMVIASRPEWRVHYIHSIDGDNWQQNSPDPILHLSGYDCDKDGHYKPTIVPVAGEPLLWDIWVAGLNANGGGSVYGTNSQWRILHFRNVDLENGTLTTIYNSKISKSDNSSILIAANNFSLRQGNPTFTLQNTVQPAWIFDGGVDGSAGTSFKLPSFWEKIQISFYCYNATGETGDVDLYYYGNAQVVGDVIGTNPHVFSARETFSLGTTVNEVQKLTVNNIFTVNPDGVFGFYIRREGSNATDTFTGSLGIMGILIEKVD